MRIGRLALGLIGMIAILGLASAILDIRRFEIKPLTELLGLVGMIYLSILGGGLIAITVRLLNSGIFAQPKLMSLPAKFFYLLWFVLVAWLSEWVFMERPLTVRLMAMVTEGDADECIVQEARRRAMARGDLQLLVGLPVGHHADRVAVMIERTYVNRPEVYDRHALGSTINHFAEEFDVDPALLFGWLYLDSFYGEAVSGPMPMFRGITSETFRDLVQLHLPSWFVESTLRTRLVDSDMLERVFGTAFGTKLRYALHKSTYDLSLEPYEVDVFSDVLLVLTKYPEEFQELQQAGDRKLLLAIEALERAGQVLSPIDWPKQAAVDSSFYNAHREDMITFTRAVAYKILLDFRFATKVQALVARLYDEQFEEQLGSTRWASLSRAQKIALHAMLVDVFVPNIGSLSENVYMLPELNLAPFNFVVGEAQSADFASEDGIWRPVDYWKLWGAATTKLEVVLEVASAMGHVPSMPQLHESTSQAIEVLHRVY